VSKSRIRVGAVAGALLLVGALTACSGGQPGAAAVVHTGDSTRVISTSDVDTATRELADVLQGVTPDAITQVLVQEPVLMQVAEDEGVGVSSTQVDEFFTTAINQVGLDADRTFSEPSRRVAQFVLARNALSQLTDATSANEALTTAVADMKIDLSPRYGTVAADNSVGATTYDWLVPVVSEADAAEATTQP
jgi:hypothetical protein